MDALTCPDCGHGNQPGSRYCSSCGARLPTGDLDRTTVSLPVVTGDTEPAAPGGAPPPVGRHPDSDIFLDDITVSRRHAELHRTADGAWVVTDAGSLNGTYLNGQRIDEPTVLRPGDLLQIGRFRLRYGSVPVDAGPEDPR